MKIKVNANDLAKHVVMVSKAIDRFSPLPALSCIKFEIENNVIVLTGSNMITTIRCRMEKAEIVEEGKFVVESKFINEILKKLKNETIELELVDNTKLRIKTGNGKFNLNCIPFEEYPELDLSMCNNLLNIPFETFRTGIIRTISFCSSGNKTRPVLNGVNIHSLQNQMIQFTGTDSYYGAVYNTPIIEACKSFNITISSRSAYDVTKFMEEDTKIYYDSKKIQFKSKNAFIQARLLEGKYPELERVIPKGGQCSAIFDANELSAAIDHSEFIKSENTNLVKLEIGDSIHLKTRSKEIGFTDETLKDSRCTGNPFSTVLDGARLKKVVDGMCCQEIMLETEGEMKSIRVSDPNNAGNVICLLCPVRTYEEI